MEQVRLTLHGLEIGETQAASDPGSSRNSDGDGFTMEPSLVVRDRLERVADSMPVVQERSKPSFFFLVGYDDLRFETTRAGDRLLEDREVFGEDRLSLPFQTMKVVGIEADPVLDRLDQARTILPVRKCLKQSRIDQDQTGLVKCADQVLGLCMVDRRFAADAGIDLRQDRGG